VINTNTSLLIETLENRWQTYRSELKRCQKEASEEAIHDLRVATRRLLALVDTLRAISPHPRLQKLRRTFKNQLDSLNDLRDTQVMLMGVSDTLNTLPELALFQEYLTKRETRLLKSTAKGIRSFQITNVRKRLDSTRKALLKMGNENQQQKALLQIVDDAYETTLRRFRRIEPTQPATIHRVRVAFKKFRYMVEIVYPLVANFPDDNFKLMHDYQDLMGDIQDLEVFISVFEDFVDNDASYDPELVRRYYQQRHVEAVNTYLEDMHQINIFWRPGPESPFFWETAQRQEETGLSKKPTEPLPGQDMDGNGKQAETEKEPENETVYLASRHR
jgi:CHAD domain-containing protein